MEAQGGERATTSGAAAGQPAPAASGTTTGQLVPTRVGPPEGTPAPPGPSARPEVEMGPPPPPALPVPPSWDSSLASWAEEMVRQDDLNSRVEDMDTAGPAPSPSPTPQQEEELLAAGQQQEVGIGNPDESRRESNPPAPRVSSDLPFPPCCRLRGERGGKATGDGGTAKGATEDGGTARGEGACSTRPAAWIGAPGRRAPEAQAGRPPQPLHLRTAAGVRGGSPRAERQIGPGAPVGSAGLQAVDAHFHLDRLEREVRKKFQQSRRCESLESVLTLARLVNGLSGEPQVGLKCVVASFCDPATHHHMLRCQEEWGRFLEGDARLRIAIGFHPKYARQVVDDPMATVERLRHLMRLPRGVAFGEVGMDSTKKTPLAEQEKALRILLSGLRSSIATLPIQIHYRAGPGGGFLPRLLKVLSEELDTAQTIQVHYFTGAASEVHLWQQAFPNTFFSLGSAVLGHCTEKQVSGIREIPPSRLLLETDSPIHSGRGFSTPFLLDEISRRVAEVRGVPRAAILQLSLENATRVFRL